METKRNNEKNMKEQKNGVRKKGRCFRAGQFHGLFGDFYKDHIQQRMGQNRLVLMTLRAPCRPLTSPEVQDTLLKVC